MAADEYQSNGKMVSELPGGTESEALVEWDNGSTANPYKYEEMLTPIENHLKINLDKHDSDHFSFEGDKLYAYEEAIPGSNSFKRILVMDKQTFKEAFKRWISEE